MKRVKLGISLAITCAILVGMVQINAQAKYIEGTNAAYLASSSTANVLVRNSSKFKIEEGAKVFADKDSPTGYTVIFGYRNDSAKRVRLQGEWFFSDEAHSSLTRSANYLPEQWKPGYFPLMISNGSPNSRTGYPVSEMTKDKDTGLWTYKMPLPNGTYFYKYIIDGVEGAGLYDLTNTKVVYDPANKPLEKNPGDQPYSELYVPFDSKNQIENLSYEAPRKNEKGTVKFVDYPVNGLGGLTKDQPLGIYLPYNYDPNRKEPYKVLYLSHGGGGNESDWMAKGALPNIMDNVIADGLLESTIVVTPNSTVFDWDNINKTIPNIMNNIIPYMEANYNVSKESKDRAFAGLSMGGILTTDLYCTHPNDFGYFGIWSGSQGPNGKINRDFTQYKDLDKPTVMIGAGLNDMGYIGDISVVTDKLAKIGINFTNYFTPSGHQWSTWRKLLYIFSKDILWK